MRCPSCGNKDSRVVDSRLSRDGIVTRRRRKCDDCGRRFTTYERIEESLPMVVKKDGRREVFDRNKLIAGLKKACEKRPVSVSQREKIIDQLEQMLRELGKKEVVSSKIGEAVMDALRLVDEVAYVRFASVYRSFTDVKSFMSELKNLVSKEGARNMASTDKENKPENEDEETWIPPM